jgi:hypothetical protein
MSRNSSPISPVICLLQSRCCVLSWGNADFHCYEALRLHLVLGFSSPALVAEVVDLGLAKFGKIFIELQHCLGSLSNEVTVERPGPQGFDCLGYDLVV